MEKVVCREDIQAEMDIFRDMQYKIQMLEGQVSMLRDRVDFLETKNRIEVGIGTPIRTWNMAYGEGISDITSISDMRRIAIDAMHEAAIRDWLTEVPNITWSSNSDTN